MNDFVDLEIISAFIEEGAEMIDDVEPQLVELELSQDAAGNVDLEVVNSIFRLFHSMKGSAGFLELDYVVKLTHRAENLLDLFRRELAQLTRPDVSLLLATIDLLRKMMDDLMEAGHDENFAAEVDEQVEQLQISIESKQNGGAATDAAADEKIADAVDEVVEEETSSDAGLPQITITPEMYTRYLEEADELLDSAEQNLLEAVKEQSGAIDLSEALRCLHSFKGNSGFMGYHHLEKLAHRTETVLELVVEGDIKANTDILSVFLKVVDVTRQAVADLSDNVDPNNVPLDALMAELDVLVVDATEHPANKPEAPKVEAAQEAPAKKSGFIPLRPIKKKPQVKAPDTGGEQVTTPEVETPALTPVAAAPVPPSAVEKKTSKAVAAKSQGALKSAGSIRVDLTKLDTLMNLVGELVIAEAMVTRNPDLAGHEFENLEKASHHLRRITSDLQDVAMSVRMVPLAGTFKKMIRLVHDTALKAGKKVELTLKGEETEVDKTVIEQISDPLVHIVRNAIDHGLETNEGRIEAEKSASGQVTIEASHESGEVWITVSDDGRGLPRERILEKAISRGLITGNGDDMRNEDIYRLIFEPGFSTAAEVTEISGRGVGMDVVKKNIEKINGRVDIKSVPGGGSSFIMRIPLTMAIIEGMLVRVGRSTYNIPLLSIREAFRPTPEQVTITPDGIEVVKLREDMIPVVRMHTLYGIEATHEELTDGILVIVENDSVAAALFVDEILGQQQTVVKGLSDYVGTPHGVSGCTILGDGRISLILDVATILANSVTAPAVMA